MDILKIIEAEYDKAFDFREDTIKERNDMLDSSTVPMARLAEINPILYRQIYIEQQILSKDARACSYFEGLSYAVHTLTRALRLGKYAVIMANKDDQQVHFSEELSREEAIALLEAALASYKADPNP